MKHWTSALRLVTATALAATLTVTAADAPALAATQLITNGTFDTATDPWWSTGNTPLSIDGGRLKAAVPGGTTNRWDAMLGEKTPAIPLHTGHSYTLSFDAQVSAARQIRVTVQENADPYPATLDQLVSVTTTSQRFTYTFTSTLETTAGELTVQLGGLAGGAYTYWMDNVSLVDNSAVSGNPIAMTSGFYVDPNSNPAVWVAANDGDEDGNGADSRAATIRDNIATKPGARWFGSWSGDIGTAVDAYVSAAAAVDKLPILVAYNIPGRDACGGHSGGGAGTPDAYKTWIAAFATAIGSRPAIVIIEPDALGDFGCMDSAAIATRTDMLTYATTQFQTKNPNTWAYLDAGNPGWVAAGTMASRLTSAGVANVRGFSLNVSNYYPTADNVTYGNAVGASLGTSTPYVIDTSRNGNGSNGEWCNPAGRRLGSTAQAGGGGSADALLWVKVPGDSDGDCGLGAGIPAGQFSPDLAVHLITGN